MIDTLLTYTSHTHDAAENIAREAWLLETVPESCCTLFLWQNRRTVVIGRNQNAWSQCDIGVLEADGGFLARRLSGGGAVYHDLGNLNFTFLMREEDYDIDRQEEVLLQAVRHLGIDCERSGRNDLLTCGRKFSGNAFLHKDGRCYHHGTLLVDVDTDTMQRYLTVDPEKLSGKGVDSVRSRVVNLRDLKPDLTIAQLASSMVEAFGMVYLHDAGAVQLLERNPAYQEEDTERLAQLTEFFGSWDWRFGRRIPFSARCSGRYTWGGVELVVHVEGGIVDDAQIFSDCMDVDAFDGTAEALVGMRFQAATLSRAVAADRPERVDLAGLIARQNW